MVNTFRVMKRINKTDLRLIYPSVLWGALWLCEASGFVFMLSEWRGYPQWHDLMSTETFRADALHFKFLYAFCISASVLLVVTAVVFRHSLLRSLELLKLADEERSIDAMREALSSALASFSVNTSDGYMSYDGCTVKVPPRVAVFLDALVLKEDHTLSLEELNGLFHARFYDGTESSHSRIRNMKCTVHKTLQDTPFDVVRDAFGNFRLVLKR